MLVGLHIAIPLNIITGAGIPLKVTVLDPWLPPKLFPLICTAELTSHEDVDRLVITGGGLAVTKFAVSVIGPLIVTVALGAAPE
jgi:hypothetical protein